MEKHHCNVHGEYEGYSGCPDCQRAEERSAEGRQDLLQKIGELSEQAERAAYKSNNPGDYDCPACRMKSLKKLASRCPLCQADVPNSYWTSWLDIWEKERAAKEAHEKWLASPAYAEQRASEQKQREQQREQIELQAREKKGKSQAITALFCAFIPCVGGIVSLILAHKALGSLKGTNAKSHQILAIFLLVVCYGSLVGGFIWMFAKH